MTSKIVLKLIIFFVLTSLVLTACGGISPQKPAVGEGEVDIIDWPGYIERGGTDPNYDWVTQFEKDTGCKVKVKDAATSDEMVALMNQGGFDLVTASGDASLRLVFGGVVQPLDLSRIPAYSTVDPRLQNAPWHTVNGKHYGVSYQFGPNILMYNTKTFPTAPTSWEVVFKEQTLPDGTSNAKHVQAYSGPIYMADAAVYLKAHNAQLAITDPYELTQPQFDAVVALLRTQRQIVAKYWHDATAQVADFTNGGFVASSSWPYQVNLLKSQNQPIASTFPSEGVTGWADTTMMHIHAPHPNCAYMWLNHSINPKLQGDVAAWFGSNPAVPAGCTSSTLLGTDGCKTNGYDNFAQIAFWKTPIADCGNGQTNCVPYDTWVKNFQAIIGGQ